MPGRLVDDQPAGPRIGPGDEALAFEFLDQADADLLSVLDSSAHQLLHDACSADELAIDPFGVAKDEVVELFSGHGSHGDRFTSYAVLTSGLIGTCWNYWS